MNLPEVLQKLDAGAQIELFVLDTTVIGGTDVYNFHAGTNNLCQPIVWQGVTYQPFPIQASGFEMSARGLLPRPKVQIANVTSIISTLVIEYDDLVGAKLTRKRTFAMYLDGQPGADATQYLPDDIYFVDRKTNENPVFVEFELASAMDLEGVQLPSRIILVNYCPWTYRNVDGSGGCSYTGSNYFDVNDNTAATRSDDVCSKTINGCKKRFGTGNLPFGGFPAARTYS